VLAVRRDPPSVPVAGRRPTIPRRFSQAAWFNAGSDPTKSRIIFHAAMLSAPSGAGPIASETEHCGQKQIRCAADFCRGLIPTVCANMYTATDLCPASSSRLQRRQYRVSKERFLTARLWPRKILSSRRSLRKYVEGFPPRIRSLDHQEPSCALVRTGRHQALCCHGCDAWVAEEPV